MGNIGDPIVSGSIPAVGTSGTTYASNLNLFLTEVQNRLEALVPRSSLEDGALDMNGYSVQNSSYVGITDALSSPVTPDNSLQAFGGNLYWINTGGPVQITSGTSLNTSLVGGITGDYGGANPAQFRFVDADQEYYAYDDYAGGAWARLWAKNFDLAAGATSANRVRMAYGGGASYTLTFPSTPGSTLAMQMDSSGTISTSNTFLSNITAPDVKFTTLRSKYISGAEWAPAANAGVTTAAFSGNWTFGNSNLTIYASISLDEGDLLDRVDVFVKKLSDATNTMTVTVNQLEYTTATLTALGSATLATNAPGASIISVTGLNHTIAANKFYSISINQSDPTPSGVDVLYGGKIIFKRP